MHPYSEQRTQSCAELLCLCMTVLASQPRLLVLQIVKAGLRVILFSAHIPHETRERERKEVLAILDGILQRSAG